MSQNTSAFPSKTVIAILGAASLAAIAVALTTPKTGKEVRSQLLAVINRLRGRAGQPDLTEEDALHMLFI
jgi:hypothetical protein